MVLGNATTSLLDLTSFVVQGFKNNLQADVIYPDISKAFDSVNHLLYYIIDLLGFPVDLLNWILSNLNGTACRVKSAIVQWQGHCYTV